MTNGGVHSTRFCQAACDPRALVRASSSRPRSSSEHTGDPLRFLIEGSGTIRLRKWSSELFRKTPSNELVTTETGKVRAQGRQHAKPGRGVV